MYIITLKLHISPSDSFCPFFSESKDSLKSSADASKQEVEWCILFFFFLNN